MAQSPVVVLTIIIMVLGFQALLFGEELADKTFPKFDEVEDENQQDESEQGFFRRLFGGIGSAIEATGNFLRLIWGAIRFVVGLMTFDIPGAPWWIRVTLSVPLLGSLMWSILEAIRGT